VALGQLSLPSGESVVVLELGDGPVLELRCADEQPLFTYHVRTGQVEVRGPVTQVRVSSPEAGLALQSGGDIALEAKGRVRLHGNAGVELAAGSQAHPMASARLTPTGIGLFAPEFAAVAQTARIKLRRLEYAGAKLRAAVGSAQVTGDRLELRVKDLRTKVHSAVQQVETSLTVRAGSLREWIKGSRYSKSQRVDIKANEDVRVDGNSIFIG
jgi:hypothetical protein